MRITDLNDLSEIICAQPSFTDCLACSGCLSTDEKIAVAQHSVEPVLARLADLSLTVGVSVARQSIAAIAANAGIPLAVASAKFKHFAQTHLRAVDVVETDAVEPSLLAFYVDELERRLASSPGRAGTPKLASRRVQRFTPAGPFPLLVSACPGVVCFIEKTRPDLVKLLCPAVSLLSAAGRALKPNTYHLSVQPCHDMKLDATAVGLFNCITTVEAEKLAQNLAGTGIADMPEAETQKATRQRMPASVSGGYAHHLLSLMAAKVPTKITETKRHRDFVESELRLTTDANDDAPILRVARVYGFNNIQNMLRLLGQYVNGPAYHFVELMACPLGCVNGGGNGGKALDVEQVFYEPHASEIRHVSDLSTKFEEPKKRLDW